MRNEISDSNNLIYCKLPEFRQKLLSLASIASPRFRVHFDRFRSVSMSSFFRFRAFGFPHKWCCCWPIKISPSPRAPPSFPPPNFFFFSVCSGAVNLIKAIVIIFHPCMHTLTHSMMVRRFGRKILAVFYPVHNRTRSIRGHTYLDPFDWGLFVGICGRSLTLLTDASFVMISSPPPPPKKKLLDLNVGRRPSFFIY